MKKYTLSTEEKSNIDFRKAVMGYLVGDKDHPGLIAQDLVLYIETQVKKRLGLSDKDKVSDINGTEITVEEESRIVLPNDEQTSTITKTSKRS